MDYTANIELFKTTFAVAEGGKKLTHNSGKRFKVFPFNSSQENTSPAVDSLDSLVGYYLSLIEGMTPKEISLVSLVEQLEKEAKIEPGKKELFREVVSQLFFENGQLRSLNLKMREHAPLPQSAEIQIAKYLVDVLGDRDVLQNWVKRAMDELSVRSNVFERLVISKLENNGDKPKDWLHYTPVTTAVKSVFEQDFEYILSSETRTRDYLLPLLEFYYFTYTAQACLHLERLCDGKPASVSPIYFCLEWEKTNQSRPCYTKGWQRLKRAVEKLYAHVNTLEVLNQTVGDERYDYVKLAQIAARSPEDDAQLANQIQKLSSLYRNAITDSTEMDAVTPAPVSGSRTPDEIRFLFESIKAQFGDTTRGTRYRTYAEKFKKFCEKKFLKSRGRSGYMLNISEETLIFLTKVSVKDREIIRLKDVFEEFERRGVFLDNVSKEQVTQYFEKLNLIEKKSDSGDAKYVKRIL